MRYKRQLSLVDQSLLADAHILVVGVGGLGSSALYYLAAAGVGKISIIDFDTVEESNLNRQVLHFTSDIGKLKIDSAFEKLTKLNPEIQIEKIHLKITEKNLDSLPEADLIVDCLDNMETRMLLNKFCVERGIPLIHAAVEGFEGRMITIIPGETPCLSCIYAGLPPKKGEFPIIGATAGFLGTAQAMEAIKFITKKGSLLKGKMLIADLLNWEFAIFNTVFNPRCPVCGGGK